MGFLELLKEEYSALEEVDEQLLDFVLESCETAEDVEELREMFDLTDEEVADLYEQLVKRVSSDGRIRKTMSRQIRSRRASATTGLSKSQLRLRARKSVRTKKRTPSTQRVALRKRRKALRRRKQYGL